MTGTPAPVLCWRCQALLAAPDFHCDRCNAGLQSPQPPLSEAEFVERYRSEVTDE